ncbi:hypothetical protein [Flavobacterium sp. SM2513]|uniref:hypothetical protein n=1 Tax=Flavobacterium sp. SM2513 TaxID=3424766 RepID=UPI003D7FAC1C
MEWIIFQQLTSTISASNYYNSIKIAYLLNLKIASIGIDDSIYYLSNLKDNLNIDTKLEYLINENDISDDYQQYLIEVKQSYFALTKIKYKSSKENILLNTTKKWVENAFIVYQNYHVDIIGKAFDIARLKELLAVDIFYFYFNNDGTSSSCTINNEVQLEVLMMTLNEEEEEYFILFLSNNKIDGVDVEVEFLNPMDKKAEDKNNFYGEVSYTFPLLDSLSSTELISTRKNLEKTTLAFREKINEWASICLANPNTNLGLEHFKKELQPFLKSTQNEILENPLLQNVSSLTNKKLESQIIIGEAPIEKIWQHYLDSKNISQDVYDDLMKIKTEQFPRFEGRWPIVFYKLTEDALKDINEETENDGVQSVRKSISLD